MSGTRRLSLRARMLVLLIGVTTGFLLIMGAVSTVVLSAHLSRQFNASLIAESTNTPQQLQASPGGYVAVEVTRPLAGVLRRPAVVTALTPDSAATRQLRAAVRQLIRAHQLRDYPRGQPFTLPGTGSGPRLRAVDRVIGGPAGRALLVVAQRPGVLTSQLRGFIIAELITGGALIALLAIGGEWLIGRGLRPLDEMASTAHEITSHGNLTARMSDAGDDTEVGRLAAAINTMLDRIQHAFGARLRSEHKVREFAADASHELRTPLTTIRGYAELYRQGALDAGQLPRAMRRIEQEAQRMSTLVAELLELARLDRGSSLDLAETDLAGVVRDAVADAAAVEPDRPVRAEAPPRLVAVVDEPRIRQVLANLLSNVRAHTPGSAPVAVRLGEITGGVLIEVADAGPGMSEQDAARAFDRFHRAGPSGDGPHGESPADGGGQGGSGGGRAAAGPDGGGSGLGLSIVQAIAAAHGGRATLESWPERGTRVRIWLPVRPLP